MKLRNIEQDELEYIFKGAKSRMNAHPERAKRDLETIKRCHHYQTKEDALKAAVKMRNDGCLWCQIWANVSKDEEYYFVDAPFIVSDDNFINLSAEYIGMAQIYR